MITVKGKMDDKEVRTMLTIAPKAIRNTLEHWLYSERRRYIGSKAKPRGKFRRDLYKLRRGAGAPLAFRRSGKWAANVVEAFTGHMRGRGTDIMAMHMGAGIKKSSKFMKGLEMMDVGYTGERKITSDNHMMIPVYRNLKKRNIKVSWKRNQNNAVRQMFDDWAVFKQVRPDGTILYFDEKDRYKGGENKGRLKKSALLFIGKKMTKLKPKFNFVNQWMTRTGAVQQRGVKMIDKTLRGLERGYIKMR